MKYLGGSTANTKDVVTQDQIIGIANFTHTLNIASPNATVPVIGLGVVSTATNADLAITPKGTGAITAQVATSTAVGGNKRGLNALDLQTSRSGAAQVASGNYSVVMGQGCTASGANSTAVGYFCTSSGISSIALGDTCTASGTDSVSMGVNNTASGSASTVYGGQYGTTRGITGATAWGSYSAALGQTQTGQFLLRADTVGATPTRVTETGGAASSNNGPVLPNTSTYYCRIRVLARNTTNGDSASWSGTALIHREANAASTVLIGTPVITQDYASASLVTAAVTISADTTLGALAVTGIAATNIRWVAHVETLEATN
jgi:hypothetical protein